MYVNEDAKCQQTVVHKSDNNVILCRNVILKSMISMSFNVSSEEIWSGIFAVIIGELYELISWWNYLANKKVPPDPAYVYTSHATPRDP